MKGHITKEQLSDSLKNEIESIGDKEQLQTEDKSSIVNAINENKTSILDIENYKINKIYNLNKNDVDANVTKYTLPYRDIKINVSTASNTENVYFVSVSSSAPVTNTTIYIRAVKQGEDNYEDYLLKVQAMTSIPTTMRNATVDDFNAGITGIIKFLEYDNIKYAILTNVKDDYSNTAKVSYNIESNTDLNNIKIIGTYATTSASISTTLINTPSSLKSSYYCNLSVKELGHSSSIILQELTASFNASTSRKFFRRYVEGRGWDNWSEIVTTDSTTYIYDIINEQDEKIVNLDKEVSQQEEIISSLTYELMMLQEPIALATLDNNNHSSKFNLIKSWFNKGYWNEDMLLNAVERHYITEEEMNEIIG